MKHPKLAVEKRTLLGKKIKKLRHEGIVPANIYGKDLKSIAVQLPLANLMEMYKEVGKTGIVDVEVEGTIHPSLIHNVQKESVNHNILHVDFFKVNLTEKMTAAIPVVLIGEAKAVTDKVGMLLQPLNTVEVEALPEDLPENIEVNVEHLALLDQQITVAELKTPTGVTITTDPNQVVVKVAELVSQEAVAQAAEEAAAAEETKAEEGETQAENAEAVKEQAADDKNQEKSEEKSKE